MSPSPNTHSGAERYTHRPDLPLLACISRTKATPLLHEQIRRFPQPEDFGHGILPRPEEICTVRLTNQTVGKMSTGLRLASSMFATILALTACAGTSQDSPADGPPESPTTTSTADQSSPSSTPPTATTSSAAGSEQAADGSCTITVTGDRDGEWTFPQSIYSITSDHWLSEEELRDTVDQLGTDIAGGTYEEITSRGDPVVTFLALGCQDANNLVHGVFVTHTNGTKTTDLPMESGDYEITGGLFDAEGPTGTIIAGFDVSPDELYGTVSGSGTLEITRWDRLRIEGRISFSAVELFVDSPREVDVSVEFSYACAAWHSGC